MQSRRKANDCSNLHSNKRQERVSSTFCNCSMVQQQLCYVKLSGCAVPLETTECISFQSTFLALLCCVSCERQSLMLACWLVQSDEDQDFEDDTAAAPQATVPHTHMTPSQSTPMQQHQSQKQPTGQPASILSQIAAGVAPSSAHPRMAPAASAAPQSGFSTVNARLAQSQAPSSLCAEQPPVGLTRQQVSLALLQPMFASI